MATPAAVGAKGGGSSAVHVAAENKNQAPNTYEQEREHQARVADATWVSQVHKKKKTYFSSGKEEGGVRRGE